MYKREHRHQPHEDKSHWLSRTLTLIVLALNSAMVAAQPPAQATVETAGQTTADDSHPLLHSPSTVAEWEVNRREVLKRMQTVMGALPANPTDPSPRYEVLSETDCGDYVRKRIRYLSQPDCWTPAFLCVPKKAFAETSDNSQRPQLPAVLCLHPTDNVNGHKVVVGLGGLANRQYASELAERGYVTLSPSYPLLADYQPDLDELGWESGTLKAVWDNMRGIDLLQSMPYVDAQAIAAIGHSLGGHNAVYTAVFDPRLRAVVSSCGLDSYRDYYGGDPARWALGQGWTSTRYMPRLAAYQNRLSEIPFDFPEMIAALAPRHVFIIAPLHDTNFQAASVDKVADAARPVFALYGHSDRLQVAHPDCGHDFPPEQRQKAYRLFDAVLMKD